MFTKKNVYKHTHTHTHTTQQSTVSMNIYRLQHLHLNILAFDQQSRVCTSLADGTAFTRKRHQYQRLPILRCRSTYSVWPLKLIMLSRIGAGKGKRLGMGVLKIQVLVLRYEQILQNSQNIRINAVSKEKRNANCLLSRL